jgi:hypothetical protein
MSRAAAAVGDRAGTWRGHGASDRLATAVRRRGSGRLCVATALGFHLDLADMAEQTLFIKDLAIAGALMVIAASAWQIRGVATAG